MAESMQGLKRSHRCAEVSNALEGQKVTVMGWVQKSRNKGGIIFVDLKEAFICHELSGNGHNLALHNQISLKIRSSQIQISVFQT